MVAESPAEAGTLIVAAQPFPIAGMGASAGGLAAVIRLRKRLGDPSAFDLAHRVQGDLARVEPNPTSRLSSHGDIRAIADRASVLAISSASVVINHQREILEFRGNAALFFAPSPGMANLDVLLMAREELRLDLRAALDEARAAGKPVRRRGVLVGSEEDKQTIDLRVVPFFVPRAKDCFFAVLFEDSPSPAAERLGAAPTASPQDLERDLRSELAFTRECLRSIIDRHEASHVELRALSEETLSSNEELHRTNEELQTTKEELLATNGEIVEYREKLQRMAFDATVAEEHERRRIAVDLHDRIGQALAVARLKMISAYEGVSGGARDAIQQALDLVAQTIADTRTLMFDLSPPILYDLGFREALSWLAEQVEGRHRLHVDVTEVDAAPPLDETTAAILFRCVRELLMNVVKHSDAGQAHVSLSTDGGHFEIEVADEGRGFGPETATPSGGSGFGLFSVREQMSRLGGMLEIASVPAQGTRVTLRVPIAVAIPPKPRTDGRP